jgi:hypothetical protein
MVFFTASVRNILDTPSYAFTTPYDYVTMYQVVRSNTVHGSDASSPLVGLPIECVVGCCVGVCMCVSVWVKITSTLHTRTLEKLEIYLLYPQRRGCWLHMMPLK